MAMQKPAVQERHFGRLVWVNPTTEAMREAECLCFNCDKCKPGEPGHCPIATRGYEFCVANGTAFTMTRCPEFVPK